MHVTIDSWGLRNCTQFLLLHLFLWLMHTDVGFSVQPVTVGHISTNTKIWITISLTVRYSVLMSNNNMFRSIDWLKHQTGWLVTASLTILILLFGLMWSFMNLPSLAMRIEIYIYIYIFVQFWNLWWCSNILKQEFF